MELGLNKPKTMLKQYEAFILGKKLCFWLFLVFLEDCVCVIIAVEKVLTVELGLNKPSACTAHNLYLVNIK